MAVDFEGVISVHQVGERGEVSDEITKVSGIDAADGITAGSLVLASDNANPPTVLVEELIKRLNRGYLLGPSGNDPKVIRKVSEEAFRNGLRQPYVEGAPVNWVQGVSELKQLCSNTLLGASSKTMNPFSQCWVEFRRFRRDRGVELEINYNPTELEMSSKSFVPPSRRMGNFMSGTRNIIRVPQEWRRLF